MHRNTIPKLRGTDNYMTWRIQIEIVLLAKKVLRYVTGRKSVAPMKKQFTSVIGNGTITAVIIGNGTITAVVIDEDKFEPALEE